MRHFQQELALKLADYEQDCGHQLVDVIGESQIIYNPTEVNRFGNKYNIDFDYSSDKNDERDVFFFNTLMNRELRLQQLPHTGNLEERMKRLKKHLMVEQKLKRMKEAISRTEEGKEVALILIKQAIPCIMHLENRGGEKIGTVLVSIGATRFRRDNRMDNLEQCAELIEDLVRKRILGTNNRPKHWKLPLNDQKKEVSLPFL